ncbi:T9SS type A sorting domain-containing protein [Fluviicola taffensis]|uniref:Secretion system C-terminal sorting domain-containing protein n=1 Tax=Fluviicola taffensis (strain DSM 16823 / NCIMB 13979 / RW262) TaxID=755732 RepID=F2IK15_FLUTR|nr:T9SS type A sorting domain-containing protein [Fluviicola taffensis]AEA42914.1 hypothetical protein Fluta_0913 [Fluviicola taffensis DSM 16823]
MKKSSLFLFLVLVNNITNAQNLTRSDIGYQIGENYIMFQSMYLNPGSDGIGVTWDLSSMTDQFGQIDVTISDNTSLFPNSNAVMAMSIGYNDYFNITNNSIEVVGGDFNGGSIKNYTNAQTFINFPITSLSNFTDTYESNSNGGSEVTLGNIHEEFSGSGTLITPIGTFTDAIRLKQTRIQSSTINSITQIDTTISYLWFKAGVHHELAVLQTIKSTLGDGENGYYTSADPALKMEENQLFNVSIYPNPTSGNIQIKSTENILSLKIYKLSGELVLEKDISNSLGIELNIDNLNSGIYLIHFYDENGATSVKRISKI